MKITTSLLLASITGLGSAIPAAQAPNNPGGRRPSGPGGGGGGQCPPVWNQISQALTPLFVDGSGQCTALARAAIRAVFHDCGTWAPPQGSTGGCDGSVFLSAEELGRQANRGLEGLQSTLTGMSAQFQVGMADLVAFAGSHATVSCPLGPTVRTLVGRKDSGTAAPDPGLLPSNPTFSAAEILRIMADKGFSPADTAALVGAHSVSRQQFVDANRANTPQDSTPGIADVAFYNETLNPPENVLVMQSDSNLANDPATSPTWNSFIGQQGRWNRAFADAFSRLQLLGVDQNGLVDCTSALPPPRNNFQGANPPNTGGRPGGRPGGDQGSRPGGDSGGRTGDGERGPKSGEASSGPSGFGRPESPQFGGNTGNSNGNGGGFPGRPRGPDGQPR